VLSGTDGLHVIDCSNPALPVRVDGNPNVASSHQLALGTNVICVTTRDAGLVVLSSFASPGPQPFSLTKMLKHPSGYFQFTLQGEPGRSYRILASPTFGSWTTFTNITLSGSEVIITCEISPVRPKYFYQAVTP
jgi:hypothetical protein